jgi:hypothetical protein
LWADVKTLLFAAVSTAALNLEAAMAADVLATPTGTGQSSAPEAFEEIPSIRR